jgi:hypothetical protein
LLLALCALPAGLAACGDDGAPATSSAPKPETQPRSPGSLIREQPAAAKPASDPVKQRACRALREADVRRLLRTHRLKVPAGFEVEDDASDETTDCRYFADGVSVFVTIDRAAQAQKRYWYRLEEQQQKNSWDAERRPTLVKGIGQDKTYGGAGAFWTPALNRLIAYRDDTMLLIGFTVDGASQTTARAAAKRVALTTYRRLFGNKPPGKAYSLAGRSPQP